jgi:hypothetical protein
MTTSKTLESVYFHISNSGLTIEVVSDEAGDGKMTSLRLGFKLSVLGINTSTSVPIFNRDILVQLAAMVHRTLTYLDSKPGMKLHYSETMPACYKISGGQTVEQSGNDGVCASDLSVRISKAVIDRLISPSEAETLRHGNWTTDRVNEILSRRTSNATT